MNHSSTTAGDSGIAQLVLILEKTISPEQNELTQAQAYLEQAAVSNFPEYIRSLSELLAHAGHSPVARMASGLQLKNLLTSKDSNVKTQYKARWLALSDDVKSYVKKNVLGALGTETTRPSSAAQCVAYIAVIELTHGQWQDVIPVLVANLTGVNETSHNAELLREASLEAIGYICADIEPDILQHQSNHILTAIVHGMKREEPSNRVRLAATNALLNSLEFTKNNFENETERHYIMQVVCEATQVADTQVQVAALQCLVKIMSLYYQHMEYYMNQALFAITMEAMRSDVDEVALQGIEFWSNVCDEEVDLAIEASEAIELGRPPQRTSRFYAKGSLQYLVPLLIQTLTKQELQDDDDDWNPCKAAGVCLMLFANCCENDIIPHVVPFVQTNIKSENWRFRDAAVMSFGCIMEGPDPNSMKPLAETALPTLIDLMKDENVVVRDTTAWALGRICEVVSEAALTQSLRPLLEALVVALQAEPRVAANACWALSSLAEAAYEQAVETRHEDTKEPETYCLSSIFRPIVEKLLATTDRVDGNQANLRPAAYEALMEIIKNSPRDCYETVQHTTLVILERLRAVLLMESHQNPGDRSQFNELQSSLCATLQSVLRKVTKVDAPKISDAVMDALLQMLSGPGGKSGGVQEDALMAISTLTEVMGEGFLKYMDSFQPYLIVALQNISEHTVCSAAVGVSGDICRALGVKSLPYCDDIMTHLLQNLGDQNVQREVKPQILSVLGDVALAVGPEFRKYLDIVLQTLMQASQAQVDRNDFEMLDYLCELREGVLEAYTGIIQGLRGESQAASGVATGPVTIELAHIEPQLPHIFQFICEIVKDSERSDGNIAACAGLIGDLIVGYGIRILPLVDNEIIADLLTQGRRSKTNKTKLLAIWATKELRKLKNQNAVSGDKV